MRFIFNRLAAVLIVVAAVAMSAGAAQAGQRGITDDGKFFSPDAIAQANPIIDAIYSAHHRDVRIATFPAVPADMQADLQSQGKAPFFEHWVDKLATQERVNGVMLLLCQDPPHFQTLVGNVTRQHDFTDDDRRAFNNTLMPYLRDHRYDEGLLAGVKFIQSRMDANGPSQQSSAAPGSQSQSSPMYPPAGRSPSSGGMWGGWLCLGVGALVVAFLVIGAVARRGASGYGGGPGGGYGAPPGGYPPGYSGPYPQGGGYYGGGGGGGGGFGRGLLGGILGGALGSWGYDRFARGSQNDLPSNQGASSGGGFGSSSTQSDTSYTGSGADFGDNSGSGSTGGDFGSSDSSSSSSGGGDFGGGGGGDFGGGGGDSGGSSSGGDF